MGHVDVYSGVSSTVFVRHEEDTWTFTSLSDLQREQDCVGE